MFFLINNSSVSSIITQTISVYGEVHTLVW